MDSPGKLDSGLDILNFAKNSRFQSEFDKIVPFLHFTAPEVVSKQAGAPSADVFSLGCSIYSIYKALSNTSSDLLLLTIEDYTAGGHKTACLNALKPNNIAFNCLPEYLGEIIIKMINFNPTERSTLHELSISRGLQTPYVKTIYYLEHLQEKQDSQKMQFFKGLTSIIDKFDKVIMNKRLLPALVSNMQHPNLTPFILPSILTILKSCDLSKDLFQAQIWPSIAKLVMGKEIPAQSFYLILSEIDLLIRYTDTEACKKSLVPLVFKGYECGVAQIQSTIMTKTPDLIKELQDINYAKLQVLPRFLQGIINSKISSVKESGLKALALIYNSFDRATMVETIIPSLEKFKKFDITGPMIMSLLEIYSGISKVLGHKMTAISILPALLPLLVEAEITKSEFEALFGTVISMMNLIKEMRAGELTDDKSEPVLESFRNEDIEEVNDIFRDIFDVGGKPIMEAPAGNSDITDIFKVETVKTDGIKDANKETFKINTFSNDFTKEITKNNSFAFEFPKESKKSYESLQKEKIEAVNEFSIQGLGKQDLFPKTIKEINPIKPQPKPQSSPIDDLFSELSNKPREEFKSPSLKPGMVLKPPTSQIKPNTLDIKPGSLKPQVKKQSNPVPINTDDFFNEFLPNSIKKDPFAGL